MADRDRDVLDFDEEDDVPTSEELQSQVQKAHADLAELKRRQEQIERDKQRLEELARRQDELERGRAEMIDKLTRAMVVIQRETQDAEKWLDQLHSIQEAFNHHLNKLESINPKAWVGLDLSKELSKALSAVDDARGEYNKSHPKLGLHLGGEEAAVATGEYDEYYGASEKGFVHWLIMGFAFTLPLQVIAAIAFFVWMFMAGGVR